MTEKRCEGCRNRLRDIDRSSGGGGLTTKSPFIFIHARVVSNLWSNTNAYAGLHTERLVYPPSFAQTPPRKLPDARVSSLCRWLQRRLAWRGAWQKRGLNVISFHFRRGNKSASKTILEWWSRYNATYGRQKNTGMIKGPGGY